MLSKACRCWDACNGLQQQCRGYGGVRPRPSAPITNGFWVASGWRSQLSMGFHGSIPGAPPPIKSYRHTPFNPITIHLPRHTPPPPAPPTALRPLPSHSIPPRRIPPLVQPRPTPPWPCYTNSPNRASPHPIAFHSSAQRTFPHLNQLPHPSPPNPPQPTAHNLQSTNAWLEIGAQLQKENQE